MAQFIPSLEKIKQFKVQPTEGEWYLLRFLECNLDESYEVYFNPYLNGDRPDILIMKKGGGVLILEVKDWNLDAYRLDEKKHWFLKFPKNEKEQKVYIKSPVEQSVQYKRNLYNLHVEHLFEKQIKSPKLWKVVNCGVFFHNAREIQVKNLLVTPYSTDKNYSKFINSLILLGRDSLTKDNFDQILRKNYMSSDRQSYYFDDELYNSIRRLLIPPIHVRNQGIRIQRYNGILKKRLPSIRMYSKKQDELIFDEKLKRKEWRVKGVVGAGKTTLMAAKAVNSYKELLRQGVESPKILILTFNITLKNFIHDKLNQVSEEFDWKSFTIQNYHQFINFQLNNLGIVFHQINNESKEQFFARYYDNYQLFAEFADKTMRYDVIFIDEIQDFKRVWMDIIKDYFLNQEETTYPRGGYYLLGDVKQNIYTRKIDKKDVVTNVLGVNTLDTCFRSDKKIKDLAIGFQHRFFNERYDLDETLTAAEDSLFCRENIQQGYLNYKYLSENDNIRKVFNIIEGNIQHRINEIAINDITILGSNIEFLKKLDVYYRYKTGRRSTTMFETVEYMIFQGLRKNFLDNDRGLRNELNTIITNSSKRPISDNQKENQLVTLLTLLYLNKNYPSEFLSKLEIKCYELRISLSEIQTLFDTYQEQFDNFLNQINIIDYKFVQDNKKYNFWMNTGNIKFCTIQSFKGWESDTIFLLLEKRNDYETSFEETIYTGLTRASSNLVVLNIGNETYHENMKRLIDTYK